MNVHRITAPWIEGSATWSSFAGAFDSTVAASFSHQGAAYVGPVSFDVTSLVSGWVSGAVPNNGLLLEQSGANVTNLWSSESGAGTGPRLHLCYTISG